jgi:CelD/BcsL family acetyltransferase involved in cellulose biosynthesis
MLKMRRPDQSTTRIASSAGAGEALSSSPFSIRIEVFHSVDEVEAKWREAQECCACYGFQTFEWLSTWYKTIGISLGVEPLIVYVADTSRNTLMLLPLGLQRRLGLSFISFLGGDTTDYNAPIVRADFAASLDAAVVDGLMARVLKQLPKADVILLKRVPLLIEGSVNPLLRLPGLKHTGNAWVAVLGQTFADFKKRRSAKHLRAAERNWRRLSEIAPTRVCIADTPDSAAEIMRALVLQKRRRWREMGSADLFAKPGYLAFYSTLAERHLKTGLIQVSALRVGEAIVATHWGMVFRSRFYWLMPTFEAGDWARFSVGGLLMQSLVEWSISRGLSRFDLTIGDEAYKRLWVDHTMPLYEYIRGMTTKGRLFCELRQTSGQVKKWAARNERIRRWAAIWRRHLREWLSRKAIAAHSTITKAHDVRRDG